MAEQTTPARALSGHHRAVLGQGSAIAPAMIAERGYWTSMRWQDPDGLPFRGTQKGPASFPALAAEFGDIAGVTGAGR